MDATDRAVRAYHHWQKVLGREPICDGHVLKKMETFRILLDVDEEDTSRDGDIAAGFEMDAAAFSKP